MSEQDTALKILIEQAKQRIENIFTEGVGSPEINFCFKELFEYAENELKLPTLQEWISVEDKLPDERMVVLVITKHEFYRAADWEEFTDQNKEWFKNNFTHWMPLPKPPNQ